MKKLPDNIPENVPWKGLVENDLSNITIIDSEGQSLNFRVGEVFFDKGKSATGLWVEYQEEHMKSKSFGPVLMNKDNWEKIKRYIDKMFKLKMGK